MKCIEKKKQLRNNIHQKNYEILRKQQNQSKKMNCLNYQLATKLDEFEQNGIGFNKFHKETKNELEDINKMQKATKKKLKTLKTRHERTKTLTKKFLKL